MRVKAVIISVQSFSPCSLLCNEADTGRNNFFRCDAKNERPFCKRLRSENISVPADFQRGRSFFASQRKKLFLPVSASLHNSEQGDTDRTDVITAFTRMGTKEFLRNRKSV